MRKRGFYLVLVFLVVAGVLVGVFAGREREPEYGGKRLSEWVERCSERLHPPPAALWARVGHPRVRSDVVAEDAIRATGTNAIPYLLTWIRYEPPAWKTQLFARINRLFRRILIDHQALRAEGAAACFGILGQQAEPTVPALAKLINDRPASMAVAALMSLSSQVLTADLVLMTNNSASARLQSISMVSEMGSRGTNVHSALPVLIQCLRDPVPQVAEAAAKALIIVAREPALVVPELTQTLQDKRPLVRRAAIEALGAFQVYARSAVPALVALALTDPNRDMRQLAAEALHQIDPQAMERATR